jgi:TonB-linked SusC/RagA family outer membrane protein
MKLKVFRMGVVVRVMVLLIAISFLASPIGAYAQEKTITATRSNIPLKDLLKEIEGQAGVSFIYSDTKIDVLQRVSVDLRGVTLNQALDKVLGPLGIAYRLEGKQIALSPQPNPEQGAKKPEKFVVSGKVTDPMTRETLPGVNIMVKGTGVGTVTDFDGNYKIEALAAEPILLFSFVGYISQEVPVNGRAVINIDLEQDVKKIDEVVVIGYGTESKRLLTGSIGAIGTEGIKERPIQSIDNILQGQSSGVQISQNSGTPGAAMTVRIRGNSSINAGNQPLYVIDGIPVLIGDYSQVSFQGQNVSALSDLNPNDIESISILKDASAAAIYGARASNGVVLITTKRGKSKTTNFNFNFYTGQQRAYNLLELLDAKQFLELRNNIAVNDGGNPVYSQSQIDNWPVNNNWLDQVFRTAPITSAELSVSSGGEKTTYYLSGSYFNQTGILLGTDFSRLSGRFNIDHTVNNWFKLGSGISLTNSFNNRVEGDQTLYGPLPNALSSYPISPTYNADGTYYEGDFYANPVSIALETINQARTFRSLANIFAELKLTKGLLFQTKAGYDFINMSEHSFEPTTTRQGAKYNGLGFEAFSKVTNLTASSTLDYNTTLDKHSFGVMGGASVEAFESRSNFVRGQDFPSNSLQYVASAAVVTGSASFLESSLLSFFTRIKYNYDFRYLVTLNARYDGSSRFGENNKFGFFPSASVAWRISEEAFMKDLSWLSDFKLRYSSGITGNDRIGNFAFMGLYGASFNYGGSPGTAPLQLPNPDLKWETTFENNIGIDFGAFNDRITFAADYYVKQTKDLLLQQPVSPSSGFESVNRNVGEIENRGFEFNLSTNNLTGSFKWTSSINISINRNKVVKLYGDVDRIIDEARGNRGGNAIIVGEPLGVFYGYKWLGVDPTTGDCVYFDKDGDGLIGSPDRMIIGSPHPDFTGGLTNNFNYKGLSLNVLLQFSYGNQVFNGSRMYLEGMGGDDNQTTAVLRRWRTPGDITDVPRATALGYNNNANLKSNRFIEDASFLRVKSLTLSYDLPRNTVAKLKLGNAKVYISVQNLFTLSNYSGMDPDVNFAGVNNLYIGTDFFTYPQARTFTVGLSTNF